MGILSELFTMPETEMPHGMFIDRLLPVEGRVQQQYSRARYAKDANGMEHADDGRFGNGGGKSSKKAELTTKPSSDGKFTVVSVKSDVGYLHLRHEGKTLKPINTEVDEAERGKGHGKQMYMQAAEYAEKHGLKFVSDATVEIGAVRVWESLAKMGYPVKRNPNAKALDDGTLYVEGGKLSEPVFSMGGSDKYQKDANGAEHDDETGQFTGGGGGKKLTGKGIRDTLKRRKAEDAGEVKSQSASRKQAAIDKRRGQLESQFDEGQINEADYNLSMQVLDAHEQVINEPEDHSKDREAEDRAFDAKFSSMTSALDARESQLNEQLEEKAISEGDYKQSMKALEPARAALADIEEALFERDHGMSRDEWAKDQKKTAADKSLGADIEALRAAPDKASIMAAVQRGLVAAGSKAAQEGRDVDEATNEYLQSIGWSEKYSKRFVTRYAKNERWITLNGNSGEDGNGGTPVKIDGSGKITAGPKGLAEKGVKHLDDLKDKKKPAKKKDPEPRLFDDDNGSDKEPKLFDDEPRDIPRTFEENEAEGERLRGVAARRGFGSILEMDRSDRDSWQKRFTEDAWQAHQRKNPGADRKEFEKQLAERMANHPWAFAPGKKAPKKEAPKERLPKIKPGKKPKAPPPKAFQPEGSVSSQDVAAALNPEANKGQGGSLSEAASNVASLKPVKGKAPKPEPKAKPKRKGNSDNLWPYASRDFEPDAPPPVAPQPAAPAGDQRRLGLQLGDLDHKPVAPSEQEQLANIAQQSQQDKLTQHSLWQSFQALWKSWMKPIDGIDYGDDWFGRMQSTVAKTLHSRKLSEVEVEQYQRQVFGRLVGELGEGVERAHYKAGDTRWITVGNGEGGTPIQIDGKGNILKGPAGLADKGVTNLKHFDRKTREPEKEAPSRASAKDQLTENVTRAAKDWGIDESELRDAISDVWEEKRERLGQREKAKEALRKMLGVTAGDINRLENAGFDHASDSEAFQKQFPAIAKRMGKADVFASELARDYPELELGDPDSDDVVGAMMERIREGKQDPPPKHDQDLVDEAARLVRDANRWRESNPVYADDEPIPYSRILSEYRKARYAKDANGMEHGDDGRFGSGGGGKKAKSLFDDHEPTPEKKKVAGEFRDSEKRTQKKMLSGLDSAPGQQDLFDNDGVAGKDEPKAKKTGFIQAPNGGATSDVNGEFYKGGHWMPIHGLSEKRPKGDGVGVEGGEMGKPNENAKKKPKWEPKERREMTPEEIEEEKARRKEQADWDGIKATTFGKAMSLGDRPHHIKRGMGYKQWHEAAEGMSEEQLKSYAAKARDIAVRETLESEGRGEESRESDIADIHDYAKDQIAQDKGYMESSGYKGKIKNAPSTVEAFWWTNEAINQAASGKRRKAPGRGQIAVLKELHAALGGEPKPTEEN